MPGKIKVTKEGIIQKALEITQKEGIEAVNARRIGKELNCSLQPVYYYFGTMDVLRDEIIRKANVMYNSYIEESKNTGDKHFRAVGIAYIKFATEEKELFKLLFMRDLRMKSNYVVEVDDNNEYIIQELMKEYNLDEATAKTIHFESWVTTHGIASMIATNYMDFTKEQIGTFLTDTFVGLLLKHKGD